MTNEDIDRLLEQAVREAAPEELYKYAFARLVAAAERAKLQDQINTLHAMYVQACAQRDELMDQQRAMVAAMRGRLQ